MNNAHRKKLVDEINKAALDLDSAVSNYEKFIYGKRSLFEVIRYHIYNDWPVAVIFLLGIAIGITATVFLQ